MGGANDESLDLLCDCETPDMVLYSYALSGDELEHVSYWLAERYGGRDDNFALVVSGCLIYPVPRSLLQNSQVYMFLLSASGGVVQPLLCGFPRLVEVLKLDNLALKRADVGEVSLYRFRHRDDSVRKLVEELKGDYFDMILETSEYLKSTGAELDLEREFIESLISCQAIPYKRKEKCLRGLARAVYSHWVVSMILKGCGVSRVEVRIGRSDGHVEYWAHGGSTSLIAQVRLCDDPLTILCRRGSETAPASGESSVLIYPVDTRSESVSADEVILRLMSAHAVARRALVTTSSLPGEARRRLEEEGIIVIESCASAGGCAPLAETLRQLALC